jgi:hypothetical protein
MDLLPPLQHLDESINRRARVFAFLFFAGSVFVVKQGRV